MTLTAGSAVGRYVVFDLLGQGAMGAVYRAWDDALDRIVAVKLLLPAKLAQGDARARFNREARLAARINHPAVAHIYDIGAHDGSPFIAMEFVPGRQLRAEMSVPLDPGRAVFLARQILDGLAEAHRQGVVHRDLKPENILLSGRDQVKILDFGLAKPLFEEAAASTDRSVGITGTPRYMAPEQFEAKPVDARTDLYALGAVLYELLTGDPAHPGSSLVAVIRSALEGQRKRITDPRVPEALAGAVERALAKDPADRFASADEMAAALGASSHGSIDAGATLDTASYVPHPRARTLVGRARDTLVGFGESQALALEMAEKAIAIDPGYALAHAIHAEAAATVFGTGHGDAALLDVAERSLDRAERLDPMLPDVRVARARMVWNKTFNFPAETALRELRLALRLDPDHAGALRLWASITGHLGLLDHTESAIERRLSADPNDAVMLALEAGLDLERGEPDRAIARLEQDLRLDPGHEDTVFWGLLAQAKLMVGAVGEAEDLLRAALVRRPEDCTLVALKALAWAHRGEAERARELGEEATRSTRGEAHPHHAFHHLAAMESVLGDAERSLAWLQRSADEGFPCFPWFERDPMLAALRGSEGGARFLADLRRRHGFFVREFKAVP